MIASWRGEPIDENTPSHVLLEIIEHIGKELQELRKDRDRWMRSGNAIEYMLDRGE